MGTAAPENCAECGKPLPSFRYYTIDGRQICHPCAKAEGAAPITETADIAGLVEELVGAATCGLPPPGWPEKSYEARLRAAIDKAATALQALNAELAEVKRELKSRNKTFCAMLSTGVCDLPDRLATAEAKLKVAVEALRLAEQFIVNGVEFNYIRIPNMPDSANDTLPAIREALATIGGGDA